MRHLRIAPTRLISTFLALATIPVLLVNADPVQADFAREGWQYYKEIEDPGRFDLPGIVSFPVDRAILAASQEDLDDLRILSSAGDEVGYAIGFQRETSERGIVESQVRNLGIEPDGFLAFEVDIRRPEAVHSQVTIITRGRDFRATGIVYTSDTGQSWKKVGEAQIFSLEIDGKEVARDTTITYPRSTEGYLRIRIIPKRGKLPEVASARVFIREHQPRRELAWLATITNVTRASDGESTEITLDFGSNRLPVDRIVLETEETNFFRPVEVDVWEEELGWQRYRRGESIHAYDTSGQSYRDLSVGFPEVRARKIRLRIHDGDSPPIAVQGARAFGLERRVSFRAEPGLTYEVYYGNPKAEKPAYDFPRVLARLEGESRFKVGLGPQEANPGWDAGAALPDVPFTERLPWLLPLAIGLAALAVGGILLQAARKAQLHLPPAGGE